MTELMPQLIDVHWLRNNWTHPDLVILDASWYLPSTERNADAEFEAKHIPGALRFDYDQDVVDKGQPLPHMVPSAGQFQTAVRRLGINNRSRVVCYDGLGVFAAPRAWWMLRYMGLHTVAVLDGGLPAWSRSGEDTVSGRPQTRTKGNFVAMPEPAWLAVANTIIDVIGKETHQIIDARPERRFLVLLQNLAQGCARGTFPVRLTCRMSGCCEKETFYRKEKSARSLRRPA